MGFISVVLCVRLRIRQGLANLDVAQSAINIISVLFHVVVANIIYVSPKWRTAYWGASQNSIGEVARRGHCGSLASL